MIDRLRDRIDVLDRAILDLLNERADLAGRIAHEKKSRGFPYRSPKREAEILELVRGGNAGPLNPGAVERIFRRIIDESREAAAAAAEGRATS